MQVGCSYVQLVDASMSTSAMRGYCSLTEWELMLLKTRYASILHWISYIQDFPGIRFSSWDVDSLIYPEKSAERPQATFNSLKTGRI